MYTTILSASALKDLIDFGHKIVIFDCSFDLANPVWGHEEYIRSHIPGSQYADLDKDLSTHDQTIRVNGGRHPLPNRNVFSAWLASRGVENDSQVVVYDRNGFNFCGRLWWMLKWCGHEAVAVLDGGFRGWIESGFPIAAGNDAHSEKPSEFHLSDPRVKLVDRIHVFNHLGESQLIIDARAAPRFRGEIEPLDPVAGHIPGALNRPFASNFTEAGYFKSKDALKSEFEALIKDSDPHRVVHHCGSGVSAVPNLIAMELAGISGSSLYAGSWSEWSNSEPLLVERG